jgi:hypothetical protein
MCPQVRMIAVGVLGRQTDAAGNTGGNQRDGRRPAGRRHLDPAPDFKGDVAALLEAEPADVELEGSILVGDGNADRSHSGDAGGPMHAVLLCWGARAAGRHSPEGRSCRADLDMPGWGCPETRGGAGEVPDPDLYLIFNEGYTASSGPSLQRVELTSQAIRLTRRLRQRLPEDGEVAGLLALMLLTDARRPARTRPDGTLVPLAEQDRGRWDPQAITEGIALVTRALASTPIGPYQLQAAIAAVHAETARFEDTDWDQILGLYELLDRLAPAPMVTLNRIVAVAMVHGPEAGLRQLAEAEAEPALVGHHRFHAVRAHLLERAGDHEAAHAAYRLAARSASPSSATSSPAPPASSPRPAHDPAQRHDIERCLPCDAVPSEGVTFT